MLGQRFHTERFWSEYKQLHFVSYTGQQAISPTACPMTGTGFQGTGSSYPRTQATMYMDGKHKDMQQGHSTPDVRNGNSLYQNAHERTSLADWSAHEGNADPVMLDRSHSVLPELALGELTGNVTGGSKEPLLNEQTQAKEVDWQLWGLCSHDSVHCQTLRVAPEGWLQLGQ